MAAIDAIGFVPWMAVWAAHAGERMLEITWPRISRCPWPEGAIRNHGYLMLYGSVRANTYRYIFSGMNIHLPAILGFTRYQGFDTSPYPYNPYLNNSGWWFQTFFIFHNIWIYIWDNPSQRTFIFFKMVFQPPTSEYSSIFLGWVKTSNQMWMWPCGIPPNFVEKLAMTPCRWVVYQTCPDKAFFGKCPAKNGESWSYNQFPIPHEST